MKYAAFITALLLVVSCPRPTITEIPQSEYLKEAARLYADKPMHAYQILKESVVASDLAAERNLLLFRIYLDQREFSRAAEILDSIDWMSQLTPFERNIVLLRTKSWQRIIDSSDDQLLKGIAYYNLDSFEGAIECLSEENPPEDYRLLYLARAYLKIGDCENALRALFVIHSLQKYLFSEYQEILLEILLGLPDLDAVQKEVKSLKDPGLQSYVMLKVYEKQKDKTKTYETAWKLINHYADSPGAQYAIRLVKPKSKRENKAYGRVLYYNHEYAKAIKYLTAGILDDTAHYYLGRIYYEKNEYSEALPHFAACSWSAADYYRGRIYEALNDNAQAISTYDTLANLHKGSDYAVRGLKRKAFLLEELGDTLNAVETFLRINENPAKFRAAMQLFRIGDLRKATQILEAYDAPDFIYWQIKAKERLAQPVDSLQRYLPEKYPLSYYVLTRYDRQYFLDTLSLNAWLSQLGDTVITLTQEDSVHLTNALRFFSLGENDYAVAELEMITADNPQELVYLSRVCAQYAADEQSIRYCLALKERAAKQNIYKLPLELLQLLYPIRYTLSIMDDYPEPTLALSMIWQESLFDPGAVSPANARGLMQIMPSTAKLISKELGITEYAYFDPATSIHFGMHYFNKMFAEFNSIPLSLAAYNAGPIRVRNWIANDPNSEMDTFIELIPYDETRNYVKSILGRQKIYRFLIGNL